MTAEAVHPGTLRRRLRGAEIPQPSPVAWRHQRRWPSRQAPRDSASDYDNSQVRIGNHSFDMNAVCAFMIVLPMLFVVQLGTFGAAIIAGVTPIYAFLRRRDLLPVVLSRLYLLIFPGLAVASVVWSWFPKESLKFSVELCITVLAGILIGSSRNQSAVMKALALTFLIYAAAAVLVGRQVGIGTSGNIAFSGLTDSKNLMADIAGAGFLVSICTALLSYRQRAWAWVALCGVAAALELYAVLSARSAGAMVAVIIAMAALICLTPVSKLGRAARGVFALVVAVGVVIVSVNYRTISAALIQFASDVFDKDPTLTGRTYLWYRAQDVLELTPTLGVGFSAFWLQGNIDAEGLWRYAGIADRGGFNFHNTFVDVRVMLGWPGAFALALALVIGSALLVHRFVQKPTMPLIFWVTILLYIACRMPVETLAIQQFYHSTLLLFAALSAGLVRSDGLSHAGSGYAAPLFRGIDYTRVRAVEVPRVERFRLRPRIAAQ